MRIAIHRSKAWKLVIVKLLAHTHRSDSPLSGGRGWIAFSGAVPVCCICCARCRKRARIRACFVLTVAQDGKADVPDTQRGPRKTSPCARRKMAYHRGNCAWHMLLLSVGCVFSPRNSPGMPLVFSQRVPQLLVDASRWIAMPCKGRLENAKRKMPTTYSVTGAADTPPILVQAISSGHFEDMRHLIGRCSLQGLGSFSPALR